jgi:pimeloyl-ACP methyl ester carboxylesterase
MALESAALRAGYVERRFRIGEVELNYAEGPDHGPPLLLIPGQTMSWHSYVRVLPVLAKDHHVFAVDIRGHGESSWTPGDYTWDSVGTDLLALLREVIGKPTIVSGNSSGGVLAVWLAAHAPELVAGILPEDPPLFSSEWPRIRGGWVWGFFDRVSRLVPVEKPRDLVPVFDGFEVPRAGNKPVMKFPTWAARSMGLVLRLWQWWNPRPPLDVWIFPDPVRLLLRALSTWDPRFTRGCADGTFLQGVSHAEWLRQVRCPAHLIRAHWFETKELGLVGAMNDDDVRRAREAAPHMSFLDLSSGHVIHLEQPRLWLRELRKLEIDIAAKGGSGS